MKNMTLLPPGARMFGLALLALAALGGEAPALAVPPAPGETNILPGAARSDAIILEAAPGRGKPEMPPVVFLHDRHSEALEAEGKDCGVCHQLTDAATEYSFDFMDPGRTENTERKEFYHGKCIGCHADRGKDAAGPRAAECRNCHRPEAAAARPDQAASADADASPPGNPEKRGRRVTLYNFLYSFLTGPGLILSLAVFFGGLAGRLALYFKGLDWRLERVGYKAHLAQGMKGGLHSARAWLIPYGTRGWRAQPFFTFCFFLLHGGAVLAPPFLLGHNEMLLHTLGFSLPSMPLPCSDALTACAVAGAALIALRRAALPEVRILTTRSDCLILALAVLPFITGGLARLRMEPYDFWLICHILAGEMLLILAPFTKLAHIVLYFASRWQLGADYAIKRGGRTRGPRFPW